MIKGAMLNFRDRLRARIDIRKVIRYAILINTIQIAAAVLVVVLSILREGHLINGRVEILVLSAMAIVVIWGAVLDIREAFAAKRISEETDMLEDANRQLETLNLTLRAQRHDFMNHLQVVYSLMELDEHAEAEKYIEKVYADIQRVGRTLKTSVPAINALLAAKISDCEERGIAVSMSIDSAWENLPISGWEMCRVLGNLIDNSIDALKDTQNAELAIHLGENIHHFHFEIANNGPVIEPGLFERIFQSGFSTKRVGRGMGLAIVRTILESNDGGVSVESDDARTRFLGVIRKPVGV